MSNCCNNPNYTYQCYSLYQCENCGAVKQPNNHKNAVNVSKEHVFEE